MDLGQRFVCEMQGPLAIEGLGIQEQESMFRERAYMGYTEAQGSVFHCEASLCRPEHGSRTQPECLNVNKSGPEKGSKYLGE